jgi:hypothetical protein
MVANVFVYFYAATPYTVVDLLLIEAFALLYLLPCVGVLVGQWKRIAWLYLPYLVVNVRAF